MDKGILIDTCSYFKLVFLNVNFIDFILEIEGEKFKIYLNDDLKYELENKYDKFSRKKSNLIIPTISKSNVIKLKSSQLATFAQKMELLEYSACFNDYHPPISISDFKSLAYQLLFRDDIIVLTDDSNMADLGKSLKCRVINSADFVVLCFQNNLLSIDQINQWKSDLSEVNEYSRNYTSIFSKAKLNMK